MKKLLAVMLITVVTLAFTGCATNDTEPPGEINSPGDTPNAAQSFDETNLSPTLDENKEIHQVVLYFPDNDLLDTYRVKTEIAVGENEQIAKAALEAWIDGPEHKELMGFIKSGVLVEYVEDVSGIAHVSFSKEVQDISLGSGGELMFAEQVAMIMQQFGYDKTQLLVEGEIVETLLGHLYTAEPIAANNPERYLWIEEKDSNEFVLQNVAFRIYEPAPGTEVKNRIVVRGLARIFEATVMYEFDDGHYILDEGFTTASEGAPGWGEFEIVIDFDEVTSSAGSIVLYEESAKDGSRVNELHIPVTFADYSHE